MTENARNTASLAESHPISAQAIEEEFPRFTWAVKKRLIEGMKSYGDASFERLPSDLAYEIEAELLDVMGWTFILYHKLLQARARLLEIEAAAAESRS